MIFLETFSLETRNLNFWPGKPKSFRETLETFAEETKKVAASLAKFIAMGLGLEGESLREISKSYEEGRHRVRMNYCPPCPEPEKVIGIVPHAGLTLLLECGNVPGIQYLKDGQWIFVAPLEGALTVNLGLILEIMSNGIYKAPEHRVVVNQLKERLSINAFCDPHACVNVEPAKELIDSGSHLPLYKSFKYAEYHNLFANWNLEVPFVDLLKI